jgi:hypothetical protein
MQRSQAFVPAHRLAAWIAIGGFALGLMAMFFVAGSFGLPAPIVWAFLVFVLSVGALLLNKPRTLLNIMMFYFLFMPANRLFGFLPIPLPGFVDELFFIPFLAVIVMYTIQGKVVRGGLWFPVAALLVGAVSFYVNGKHSPFTALRVLLINLKFFIVFYFCRLTCPFRDGRELEKWIKLYVFYGFIQYFYNVLHLRSFFVLNGGDRGTGIFFGYGAHATGYVCIFALFCLAGWWLSRLPDPGFSTARKAVAFFVGLVVFYNLTFMTDTKHGLVLMIPAAAPFFLHPTVPKKARAAGMVLGILALMAIVFYFTVSGTGDQYKFHSVRDVVHSIERRPKGVIAHALVYDMDFRLPFPLLGAGPGRFTSAQAIDGHAPLAMHYIQPFLDESRRAEYFYRGGTTAAASILGTPQSTLFTWWGEFGLPMTFIFYAFSFWIYAVFWRRAGEEDGKWDAPTRGVALAVLGMLGFQLSMTFIQPIYTSPYLSFFLWMVIGRMMDMDCASGADGGGKDLPPEARAISPARSFPA